MIFTSCGLMPPGESEYQEIFCSPKSDGVRKIRFLNKNYYFLKKTNFIHTTNTYM